VSQEDDAFRAAMAESRETAKETEAQERKVSYICTPMVGMCWVQWVVLGWVGLVLGLGWVGLGWVGLGRWLGWVRLGWAKLLVGFRSFALR
jgi:hypothetical protein